MIVHNGITQFLHRQVLPPLDSTTSFANIRVPIEIKKERKVVPYIPIEEDEEFNLDPSRPLQSNKKRS